MGCHSSSGSGRQAPASSSAPVVIIRSAFHPELFEIQFPLDRPQRLVVDLASVAKLDHGLTLGGYYTPLDLLVLDALLRSLLGLVGVLRGEVPAAIAQARLETVEQRLMGRPIGTRPLDFVK